MIRSRIYVGTRLNEVPFLTRLVPAGDLPGRVRVPSTGSGPLARSDLATYLAHGNGRAIATTPIGSIVVGLDLPLPGGFFSGASVGVVVIEDFR